jgi:hypothetical protein
MGFNCFGILNKFMANVKIVNIKGYDGMGED